jgi:hypothetical protein
MIPAEALMQVRSGQFKAAPAELLKIIEMIFIRLNDEISDGSWTG